MKVTRPIWCAAGVALSLAACGGARTPGVPLPGAAAEAQEGPVAVRVAPRGETEPVEVGGIAPNDTVLTLRRGVGRTVILRHGRPDRTEFVELILPSTVFEKAAEDTVTVTLRTRPGIYGVELSADAEFGPGTELAFKYAIHFYPPAEALGLYGSRTEIDRRLVVARRERDGDLTIYLSRHPSPDVLRALIPGGGTYVMVVGK